MFEFFDFIIVRPIINLLFVIYNFVGDFGLAIIILTVVVKLLTWPLVKKQLHRTRLIRKLQPELAKIKKNCQGNRQLESLQTLDLYKRHNIKPFRSVLILLIQLPIFIALFTSIRVIVTPTPDNNIEKRSYAFVRPLHRVDHLINTQRDFLAEPTKGYNYKPQLFGLVDLDVRPSFQTASAFIIFLFAIGSAVLQYILSRQQMPSGKSIKKRTFREILQASKDGKQPDQSDMNEVIGRQTAFMMPIMMLMIAINLQGALVFYYFFSNLLTVIQQKIILKLANDDMDNVADKAILKELKNVQEAKVIENKKTGTRITRITAKESSKKRRKS